MVAGGPNTYLSKSMGFPRYESQRNSRPVTAWQPQRGIPFGAGEGARVSIVARDACVVAARKRPKGHEDARPPPVLRT